MATGQLVVVNVAVGGGHERGQARLAQSLATHSPSVKLVSWTGRLPKGCPTHSEVPYAFKVHALEQAAAMGHRRLLWLDASMYAIGPMEQLFEVGELGLSVWQSGWMLGQWTTDAALQRLGLTRDAAMDVLLCSGGVVALDLDTEGGSTLLRRWGEYARDGVSFKGPWNNRDGSCSRDSRCLGHRHDMPSLSLIAKDLGARPRLFGDGWDYFTPTPGERTSVLAQGMA